MPDWEEKLWGTDPIKKDTDADGTPDSVEIENLKKEKGQNNEEGPALASGEEKLTETEKFSRELFSTMSALSQNGPLDQVTIDELGSSLAEQINNPRPKKAFLLSDLKIIKDDSSQAMKNYNYTLDSIDKKYTTTPTVLNVLKKFVIDENNVDIGALVELDPIIENTNKSISEMLKMTVPQSLSLLHLDLVNALERLVENVSDIKLYDNDPVVAFRGISQYDQNAKMLHSVFGNLKNVIQQKLRY
ncbi:MAG: hypothetical protein AAB532_02695 [Patescibacteria group bacterium]